MDARKERAVTCLLTSPTITAAAGPAGVSERTLRRWLAEDAEFQAGYRQARAVAFQAALGRLQGLAGRAVETLERNLEAEGEGVQVRAAVAVLELAKTSSADDLAERLAGIERQLEELRHPAAVVRAA
jgi:hypothetical protein